MLIHHKGTQTRQDPRSVLRLRLVATTTAAFMSVRRALRKRHTTPAAVLLRAELVAAHTLGREAAAKGLGHGAIALLPDTIGAAWWAGYLGTTFDYPALIAAPRNGNRHHAKPEAPSPAETTSSLPVITGTEVAAS